MATGTIKKLVHLSLQTYLPNARLVPDHNEKGYGIIEDDGGHEIYFPHDAVEGRRGFDALRKGQMVEFTREEGPYSRATSVQPIPEAPVIVQSAA